MRVLVVEDEQPFADAIAVGLRREVMAVDVAYDGDQALERLVANDYDVVVLDRDLPEIHGDEVCRWLVENQTPTRVLMLTAAGELADRVEGLNLGADDYMPKPFAFAELVARLRALDRRARLPTPPVLERAGIRLDPARREASRFGQPLTLRAKEFLVLEELLRADGASFPPSNCLRKRGTKTSTRSPTSSASPS